MSKEHLNKKYTGKTAENIPPYFGSRVKSKLTGGTVSRLQPRMYTNLVRKEPETETTNTSHIAQLPAEVQAKMENSFGQDFSEVKIHADASCAKDINAKAYAQGSEIYFAPGEYNPESKEGQELLGHELTHVVQQGQGRVGAGTMHRSGRKINQEVGLEKEADEAGKQASEGKEAIVNGIGYGIQKKENDADKTENKSITLSRGILQFISEGNFSNDSNDVRMPHFPQNVCVFQELTEDEKSNNPKKMYRGHRYDGPDTIGRFSTKNSGNYKIVKSMDWHCTETYTTKPERNQRLGITGGQSGVTIGFGLDIGNKWSSGEVDSAKHFFISGGVNAAKSAKLSKAAGVKGFEAAKLAATLRSEIRLTDDEVLTLLDKTIPDYDNIGYTKCDGNFHPAIEEALMYASYWGETSLKTVIINAAKGKKDLEQFEAVKKAVKNLWNKLDAKSWKQTGYKIFYTYFEITTEMIKSGYKINMKDDVLSKAELLSGTDDTFRFVKDISERSNHYGTGKDLTKALTGTVLSDLIKDNVGEGAMNKQEDVKVIQQLLYNGNYEVEVNGIYDDKTKHAVSTFTEKEFGKKYTDIEPNDAVLRHLKKFQYLTRTKIK